MDTPPPPDSLHLVEGLDHLTVQLPPDLTVARFLFWIFATPPAMLLAGVGIASDAGGGLLVGMGLFAFGLLVMGAVGLALEHLVARTSARPLPWLLLTLLTCGGGCGLLTATDQPLAIAVLVGLGFGLSQSTLLWLLCRNRATLRLDQHSLRIDWLWRHLELPLEELDGIGRRGDFFPPLRAGGHSLPASRSVTEEQRAWLDARVRAEASRLRAALAAQGEDLDRRPSPPPELLDRLDRS